MTTQIDINAMSVADAIALQRELHKKLKTAAGVSQVGRPPGRGKPASVDYARLREAAPSTRGRLPKHDYASWDWTLSNKALAKQHGIAPLTAYLWRKRLAMPKPVSVPRRAYDSWDWTKHDTVLSAEHGVSSTTVFLWRRRLGKPKVHSTKFYPAVLAWDWSLSNTELCRLHGLPINGVDRWRKKLKKASVAPRFNAIPYAPMTLRFDWSRADWNEHDSLIAKNVGCSRERVRQKRAELGLPLRTLLQRRLDDFKTAFTGVTELSSVECKAKFPSMSNATFARFCAIAGIKRKFLKRKSSWDSLPINWQLPNIVLAEIWGGKPQRYAVKRCELQLGKPLFWRKLGVIPDAFKALVAAEQQKAAVRSTP